MQSKPEVIVIHQEPALRRRPSRLCRSWRETLTMGATAEQGCMSVPATAVDDGGSMVDVADRDYAEDDSMKEVAEGTVHTC